MFLLVRDQEGFTDKKQNDWVRSVPLLPLSHPLCLDRAWDLMTHICPFAPALFPDFTEELANGQISDRDQNRFIWELE